MDIRLIAAALIATFSGAAPAATPPNVVVVLVDDMGWLDLSCQGSRYYETPNIDRLAAAGVRFATAYSACTVCSPTRAALLTGQWPARLHITDWIPGYSRPAARLRMPDWEKRLRPGIPNLAGLLRQRGYATASIGKWHLGGDDCSPERHGFDVNLAGTDNGQPPSYLAPYRIDTLPEGPPGEYLTDRLTIEATRFITRHRDRPFLLYLPHFAVHNPIQARPELVAKYRAKSKPGDYDFKPAYAAMIESVDESVGLLMSTLDELKLTDRTVFVFTSDNGGLMANTPTAPLRGGKGSAYEGGVRVPLIIRWPGVARPGAIVNDPVITQDVFWTMLDAAGIAAPAEVPRDGESLRGVLAGQSTLADRALYWHYPHYQAGWNSPYSAVRAGDWRLIEFLETGRCELYHLRNDPGEAANLSGSEPTRAATMLEMLNRWRSSVGAQMPTPNPNHDPARDAPAGKAKGRPPA